MIARVELFQVGLASLSAWVDESEAVLEECGPIGAHLDRLLEQADILEVGGVVAFALYNIGY